MNSKEQLNTKETAEQERSQFNILNDLDSAIEAMAIIESVEETKGWTTKAREHAEEFVRQIKEWTPLDDEDKENPPLIGSIYGNGGVHRYMIRANGDILYSAFHSSVDPENIDRARELGFEIQY